MKDFIKMPHIVLVVIGSLFLSCCESEINVRGTYIPGETLKTLRVNEDTKTSVLNKIGSPYLIINSEEWLYLSRREKTSVFSTKNIQEKNIKLKFDKNGRLVQVELLQLKPQSLSGSIMTGTDVNQTGY